MGLIEYNQLPNLDLFGIFMAHFGFSTWGILGTWSKDAYLYYNAFFLISLLWSLKDNQNEVPVILAIRINTLSILLDFLILIGYFSQHFWIDFFSIVGGILNFLLRFVTVPLLSKMCLDRTGGTNDGLPQFLVPLFGTEVVSNRRDPYDDIDVPHQSYPRSETVVITGSSSSAYTPKNPPPYQG